MKRSTLASVPALAGVAQLAACNQSAPDIDQYGANPELPDQHRGLLPNMTIARPALWGDRVPTVPEGYSIRAIATDLGIPRQTLVLPNGDILVAEGRGGNAGKLKPKRSEEHTSELQSLMRISYAVFCLKKKKTPTTSATKQN